MTPAGRASGLALVVAMAVAATSGALMRSFDGGLVCADALCWSSTVPVGSPLWGLAFGHRVATLGAVGLGARAVMGRSDRSPWPWVAFLAAGVAFAGRLGAEASLLDPRWVLVEGFASLVALCAATLARGGGFSRARLPEGVAGAAVLALVLGLEVAVPASGAEGVCLDWPACPTRSPDLAPLEIARRTSLGVWVLIAAAALARRRGDPRIGGWARVALRLSVAVLALDAAAFFSDHAVEIVLARVIALHGALVGAIGLLTVEWTDAAQSATSPDAIPLPAPRAHP